MATSINHLDPDDPGYDAAVEAALREEDEADGMTAQAGTEGEGAPAGQATGEHGGEQAEATEQQQGQEGQQPGGEEGKPQPKAAGVIGKDGKTVLPYAALKGAREQARAEREAREAAEARTVDLERQIADIKAGKTQADDSSSSDDQLQEILVDFPSMAPLVKELTQLRERVKAAPAASAAAERSDQGQQPAEDPRAQVQDAIDTVPLLAGWQHSDPEKWARALDLDKALAPSRKWAGRSLEERFAHVTKLVADEYDIQFEADEQQAEPTAQQKQQTSQRQDPTKTVKEARRQAPNTLSDFKGGAPEKSGDPIDRLPATRQVNRYMDMSDDEIDAHLARLG